MLPILMLPKKVTLLRFVSEKALSLIAVILAGMITPVILDPLKALAPITVTGMSSIEDGIVTSVSVLNSRLKI